MAKSKTPLRDVTYPRNPDKRGSARIYYERKPYYFGPHNSPESFVLFGEWKKKALELGEAPEVKTIRVDVAHKNGSVSEAQDLASQLSQTQKRLDQAEQEIAEREAAELERANQETPSLTPIRPLVATALASAAVTAAAFFLIDTGPAVDGVTLSPGDERVVRTYRRAESVEEASLNASEDRAAELARKFLEMGPENAKRFISTTRNKP